MKRVRKIQFDKVTDVPNSALPVLLYRSVLADLVVGKGRAFRQRFKANGWTGIWTDTIYDYTHFHSNAHEVFGIAEGKVTLRLGGDDGSLVRLKAGDMLVLPAGIGHRRVSGNDVKAIGAYPRGQSHYDMKRQGRTIPKVALPLTDPFYGPDGPLTTAWRLEPRLGGKRPEFGGSMALGQPLSGTASRKRLFLMCALVGLDAAPEKPNRLLWPPASVILNFFPPCLL